MLVSTEKQTGGAEVEVMQKQASKREDSHDKFPTHTHTHTRTHTH